MTSCCDISGAAPIRPGTTAACDAACDIKALVPLGPARVTSSLNLGIYKYIYASSGAQPQFTSPSSALHYVIAVFSSVFPRILPSSAPWCRSPCIAKRRQSWLRYRTVPSHEITTPIIRLASSSHTDARSRLIILHTGLSLR